ncbi:MAG: hypothetical protein RXS42_06955 [Nitrososphaeria archaeon]
MLESVKAPAALTREVALATAPSTTSRNPEARSSRPAAQTGPTQ